MRQMERKDVVAILRRVSAGAMNDKDVEFALKSLEGAGLRIKPDRVLKLAAMLASDCNVSYQQAVEVARRMDRAMIVNWSKL